MSFLKSMCYFIFGVYASSAIHCPVNIIEWNKRAGSFNCPVDEVYHCALDQNSNNIEVCFERDIIAPGEERCPWFAKQGNKVVKGSPYRECPQNASGCPPKNHSGYYFDMLYLYPACTTSHDNGRKNFPTKEDMSPPEHPSICIQYCQNSTSIPDNEHKRVSAVTVLILVIAIVLGIVNTGLIWHICRKRQRNTTRNGHSDDEMHLLRDQTAVANKGTQSTPILAHSVSKSLRMNQAENLKIIERKEMHQLKAHLEQNRMAFLIGDWGCGKTTILDWYLTQDSTMPNDHVIFNCTDWFTFIESLKEWRKSLPNEVKQEMLNCREPVMKAGPEEISSLVVDILKAIIEIDCFILFIFVFDDVGTECEHTVNGLVRKIGNIDCKNVQCIVTAHHKSNLDESDQPIYVEEFEEHDAMSFLDIDSQHEKECREITLLLKCSPIALHCARTYMTNSNISSSSALELFRNRLNQRYVENISIPQKIPLIFVMEILRCSYPLVYDILQCLQFIRPKDIPIILLQFLKLPTFKNRVPMPANNFVLVVRKFSFITVTGYDLDRVINIHPGVLSIFKKSTDNATKKACIMTLLSCLSSLFSKRSGLPVARERCIKLLPHAMKTLIAAKILFGKERTLFSHSDILVLTLVYSKVIYTYNSMGMKHDAKSLTSDILEMSPFLPCAESLKRNPENAAKDTYKSFIDLFQGEEQVKLQEEAKHFVLNKVRRKRNLSCVERQERSDDYEYQISLDDYSRLVCQGNAIDLKYLGSWLFFQAHISIALSLGMKKAEGCPDTHLNEIGMKYIQYASCLAKLLKERPEFQGKDFYSVLDAEINGMVELFLRDNTAVNENLEEIVQTINQKIERIRKNGYFVSCVKTSYDADMCIFIDAMKQLIRLSLWKYSKTKSETSIVEAGKTADELRQYLAERKDFLRESFTAQTAKQCIVKCFIEQERFHDALNVLNELSTFDPFGDGDHILTKYDTIDIGLRCECCKRANENELHKTLERISELRGHLLFDESEIMPLLKDIHTKYSSKLSRKKKD